MPRLIVLNGPPGIGKSTLGRRYVDDHPLALCLDLDGIRGQLGGWRQGETRSGELARDLSIVMVRTHLGSGLDVVVPQFVARDSYLERLKTVATDCLADHHELVLLDDVGNAERRFHARLHDPVRAEHHRIAAEMVAEAGGYAKQYAALEELLRNRKVTILRSVAGDLEGTYLALRQTLGE